MLVSITIVKERLRSLDEESVCDLLEINTDDLIQAFHSRILDKLEYLARELEIMYDDSEDGDTDYDDDDDNDY